MNSYEGRRSANQGSAEPVRRDMQESLASRFLAENGANNRLNPYAEAALMNGDHNRIRVYPTRVIPQSSSTGSASIFEPNPIQSQINNWQPGRAGRILELIRASDFSSPVLPQALLYFHRFTNRRVEEFLSVAFQGDNNLLSWQMRARLFLEDLINSQQAAIRMTYMEALEVHKCHSDEIQAQGELDVCCICLDELVNGGCLDKLDCNHYFHFDCIKLWLEEKNECPICKKIGIPLV